MAHERPLVVVTDESLLDEVLRVAAAVGCELQRAPDIVAARAEWSRAPLILLDQESLTHELPRRPGLLLVTNGTPDAPVWQRAFDAGIEQVIALPDREAALVAVLADAAEGPIVPGGCVIAVVGGRGGAGASVFAAALALTAAGERPGVPVPPAEHDSGSHPAPVATEGSPPSPPSDSGVSPDVRVRAQAATAVRARTGPGRAGGGGGGAILVDCDPLGGGLDLTLGTEAVTGARWPALRLDGGRISMSTLRESLPAHQHRGRRLPFLSCDDKGSGPTAAAVASVVDAGRRAGATVVCDLPRHLGPAAAAALSRADLIVIVVPAEVRACASARRVAAQIQGTLPVPAGTPRRGADVLAARTPHLAPAAIAAPSAHHTPLAPEDIDALESLLAATPLLAPAPPATRGPDHSADRSTAEAADQPARRADAPTRPDTHHRVPEQPTTADRPANATPNGHTFAAATSPHTTASTTAPAAAGTRPRPPARNPAHTQHARRPSPALGSADRLCLIVRGPAPAGITPQDVARTVGVPLLTAMAADRKLAKALDRGNFFPRPRGPLAKAARLTLAAARAEARQSEVAA